MVAPSKSPTLSEPSPPSPEETRMQRDDPQPCLSASPGGLETHTTVLRLHPQEFFFFLILLNLWRRRRLMELYRFHWYGSVIQHPSNESLCQRAQEASENGTCSVRGFRCAAGVRKGLRRGSDAFGRCKAPNEFSLALRPSRFPLVSMFKGFNPANVKIP